MCPCYVGASVSGMQLAAEQDLPEDSLTSRIDCGLSATTFSETHGADTAVPLTPDGPLQHRLANEKSAKRKAAEALIERKASKQRLDILDTPEMITASRCIRVDACHPTCSRRNSSGCLEAKSIDHPSWCTVPVVIPPLDWPRILQAMAAQRRSGRPLAKLPCDIKTFIVESAATLGPALVALRESLQDSVVAVDLEWRPDYRTGSNNPVALMQLASATTVVLVQCLLLRMHKTGLPPLLRSFLADPSLTFIAFSWESCDELKMQNTFGVGRDCFARFIDLRDVAEKLGYHGVGLATLTHRVLGVSMLKSRSVSQSNWACAQLSPAQVQYAALDALLTGGVFRGLRLWHAAPSPCAACKMPLGNEVSHF